MLQPFEADDLRQVQAEAADPTTSGPRLQALWEASPHAEGHYWEHPGEECVSTPFERALAGNPNTPPEVLQQLAWRCPVEVSQNPVFSLVLLLDPCFFHLVAARALYHILRRSDTSVATLRSLLSHPEPEVQEAAGWHVSLHGEIHSGLEDALGAVSRELPIGCFDVLDELKGLGLVPEPMVSRLGQRGAAPPEPPCDAGADAPGAEPLPTEPQKLADWLLRGPRKDSRPRAGSANSEPQTVLERALLRHELDAWNVEARKRVASDPSQPEEVLSMLSRHRLPAVRARVAGNPSTPVTALKQLSHASLPYELCPLATNPSTPIGVLAHLARSGQVEVASSALLNPRLPREEVERLARHHDAGIRLRVAQHPACSSEVLLSLGGDVSRRVRLIVAQCAHAPAGARDRMVEPALSDAARSDSPLGRWIALTHPRVPRTRLREGAASGQWRDRLATALNPALPAKIRAPLMEDGHALVRAAARATMGGQEVDSQS